MNEINQENDQNSFYRSVDQWPVDIPSRSDRIGNIDGIDGIERPRIDGIFKMVTEFQPSGDQPTAIDGLVSGISNKEKNQVLLGATGSGKTFTMAKVIERLNRPALIMAHNKTLAAQLYGEFKSFFPENSVEYFVSYYDYYTPEAYVPRTDTYIGKESQINEAIDRMRHAATRSIFERRDCIIVASVSCIYGIGSAKTYFDMVLHLSQGMRLSFRELFESLTNLQYSRNDIQFSRGTFRVRGDTVDIFPVHYEDRAWRLSFFGDYIEDIFEFDPLTGVKNATEKSIDIYPKSHYVTPGPTLRQAIYAIEKDLILQLKFLRENDKLLEASRLEQRTHFDIESITTSGTCAGIENYSRYLTGRSPGQPPPTLLEYFPSDAILFVDESHVSVSQIGAMFKGDYQRKKTLSDHGFRLPSCIDNRPLRFEEWNILRPQTIFVSATPGRFEMAETNGIFVEQVIRPTGLVDPVCIVRPVDNQVDDLLFECRVSANNGHRVLVTTLTKKMSEYLADYFFEQNIKVRYLHSDIDTLERIQIIQDLRSGIFDVLIGINLLREGLDIPECALVAILDADKEGFLRSETSLIQTIGRAARHIDGRVILYADKLTNSIQKALHETERRRAKQIAHNKTNNIVPKTIQKNMSNILENLKNTNKKNEYSKRRGEAVEDTLSLAAMETKMNQASDNLEFEEAARWRDRIAQRTITKNKKIKKKK